MSTMHDVSKLDDLIITTIDSIKGYEHSADHADAHRYAGFFRAMAGERRGVVEALQAQSRALGGTPADYGSAAATIHRRWEDLRHALRVVALWPVRTLAREQPVEDDAERIHIAQRGDGATAHLLGARVLERHGPHLRDRGITLDRVRFG